MLTLCAALSTTILGDTVTLRDGQIVTGTITGETPASITIEASNGRFTFQRSNILKAARDSPVENQKLQLKSYLQEGKLDSAMQLYADPELHKAVSQQQLNDLIVETLANTANAVTATSDTATTLADNWHTHLSTPPDLLVFGAALCMDFNLEQEAASLLQKFQSNPTKTLRWPIATISGLLDRIANAAIKYRSGTVLSLAATLAARYPTDGNSGTAALGQYAAITNLIRNRDYLQATVLFRPEQFLHRADLFIPLGEQLIATILALPMNETNLAALQSASATVLPYLDENIQIRAYKQLASTLYDKDITQAQALADKLSANDPDLGALLQHLLEFKKRNQELTPDQVLQRYKLAAWAKTMGLLEEAKSLFLALRSDPRFTETVQLQLTTIEARLAEDKTDQLRQLYDRGNFERLKIEAQIFLRTAPPDKFARETKDLLQLAEFEKWSANRNSQNQAEAEFQQAERLFQRGEYDGALLQLNRLQLDREDSAAAEKAKNLRDRIMREKIRQSRLTQTTKSL